MGLLELWESISIPPRTTLQANILLVSFHDMAHEDLWKKVEWMGLEGRRSEVLLLLNVGHNHPPAN